MDTAKRLGVLRLTDDPDLVDVTRKRNIQEEMFLD